MYMLNFAQYRLVSFDCYGTLIDWETGIFSALRPILAAHGKTIADPELLRLYSELESAGTAGRISSLSRSSAVGSPRVRQTSGIQPNRVPGTFASRIARQLAALPGHGRGPRQAQTALPACGHFQRGRRSLRPHGAPPARFLLTYVITAQQAQAYKPSLQMFKLAQQRTGVAPGQWLHVAQSVYHDVIPARSLGISSVWVNRPSIRPGSGAAKAATGQPDLEVPNLETLARLSEN